MTTPDKCLFPTCTRTSHSRGLCASHYSTAFKVVKRGRVTWEELVAAGKATPPHNMSSSAATWFLAARKEDKQ